MVLAAERARRGLVGRSAKVSRKVLGGHSEGGGVGKWKKRGIRARSGKKVGNLDK